MIREDIFGVTPQVSHAAYIDNSAILIGNIIISDNVYIGPNVVIRADEVDENYKTGKVIIKSGASIQDCVNINTIGSSKIEIGENVVVFNGVIIKGNCYIGHSSTLMMKSIIFNSKIDNGCYVGISSIVENASINQYMMIDHGMVINGTKTNSLKTVPKEVKDMTQKLIKNSINMVTGYKYMGM